MSHVIGKIKITVYKYMYIYIFSFDSLCYPGVQPDNDVYFGINRVIGGTYRPGSGLCDANVNWIQCKKIGKQKYRID
jgi:hypothetical protein